MENRWKDVGHAADDTCAWLFRHETFKEWLHQNRGLLWISGKPGSGKSTLLKYALEHITQFEPATATVEVLHVSFFFHGRGTELQKTPLGLFRSILHQLLDKVPHLLSDFVQTFRKKCDTAGRPGEKWEWHLTDLEGIFEASLPKILKRYSIRIFIDALDECGETAAVKLVRKFRCLISKASRTGSVFSICFTCRHYPTLVLGCESEICVEDNNSGDIATYVRHELSHTESQLRDIIVDGAKGIFQWAFLVVEKVSRLERQGSGLTEIKTEIQRTPQELDSLYRELLEGIDQDERPKSLKLMQWVCFAIRPLSLDELRFAMVIDADATYTSLRQCLDAKEYIDNNEVIDRKVKHLSCGLAEIRLHHNTRIVQFIHQSVNDFFIQHGLRILDSSWQSTDLAIGGAHYRLSRSCIRYIAMEEIRQSKRLNRQDVKSKFPFLRYATTSWVLHMEQAEAKKISQVDLLGYPDRLSKDFLQQWMRIYRAIDRRSENCPPGGTTLLHIVSRYSLMSPLLAILRNLDKVDIEVDSKDDMGRTPLLWAAWNGHEAVVKLLLEKDALLESKDNNSWTPLLWAARNRHEAVVKVLLEKGAELESKDNNGRTPLSWAAGKRHEAVVKLLLEKGADLESKDNNGWTPLLWVARSGHEAVVKQLLESGAVLESMDKYGRTPLLSAARNGHEAVVKLLLERGAVLESKDKYGRTPLLWAARNRHEALVKLLLEKGAELESKDNNGRTPLSWAAANGHEVEVKLLLEKGAELETMDKDGRTPLSWAAGNGYKVVVKLLLEKGAELEAKNNNGVTPLPWAVENGYEVVVKLLLEKGAELETKDKDGRTPLSWAAGNGYKVVVKLLLEKGSELKTKDKDGRTPLLWAAGNGHEAVVKLLLARNIVDPDHKEELLQLGCIKGHLDIVQQLLCVGANASEADEHGWTPLLCASWFGQVQILNNFLSNGENRDMLSRANTIPPNSWSTIDKSTSLELDENSIYVRYSGKLRILMS